MKFCCSTLQLHICVWLVTCSLQTGLPYQYHFVMLKKNWTEAQGYCQEKYTDLATITNSQDLSSLMNATVVNSSEEAWIGLYNDINSWRWSLSDEYFYGTGEMEYRNWENAEPNNKMGQETCTTMDNVGKWNDLNCENSRSFICFTGTSNSYILFTQAKTWYEAQKYCRTYYKDLASVRNQTENDQIKNMIQGSGVIWIGLFRDSWKWSDGNNVSFHIWNSGQPDNEYGNDENCAVALLNQLGHWNDINCTYALPFFCYIDQSKIKKKQILSVVVQSSQDVSSPAVKATILEKVSRTLMMVHLTENTVTMSQYIPYNFTYVFD
ncbi:hypothetical protein P4O66_012620 [Electrophorus voltai]|uniref:C-type lectin domain-containing protein n=1 Tax=Electrophorus voltai TaxID=2609070 RepID=A0AAD9DTJ3_9TELE|nr:hypothetical protein P4O66_012620 [Electrophorus voltai]